jgi:hypothetical protein
VHAYKMHCDRKHYYHQFLILDHDHPSGFKHLHHFIKVESRGTNKLIYLVIHLIEVSENVI